MKERIVKRIMKMLLAVLLAIGSLSVSWISVKAAAVSGFSVPGLNASYTDGNWSGSGNSLSGSATGTAGGGCSSATVTTSTLTLTNASGSAATLLFSYGKPTIGSGGSVTIDGVSRTAAGDFRKSLGVNESITIVIVSGTAGAYTTSVEISNINLIIDATVTTTFLPAENGSYTVIDGNGNPVVVGDSYEHNTILSFALTATPDPGYKLMGWYDVTEDVYFSDARVITAQYFNYSSAVKPVFVSAATAIWETGTNSGKWFSDLNQALSYASAQSIDKITLIGDGTLPAGEYTVPYGKTLLVPFDGAQSVSTVKPESYKDVTPVKPTPFRTLTMAEGAHLTINGNLCVNAMVNSDNNNYTGVTSGKYGWIRLNAGSSITVANNGRLYCWGYITGEGSIEALNGASVYEPFQICDIRGGQATLSLNDNSQKVFPFSQYYVQNIEAELVVRYGATVYAVGSITISNSTETPTIKFISNSGSMFIMSSGSTFTMKYDGTVDRNYYDIEGSASINSVSMNVYISVNSKDYVLPLMENTTINVHSGTVAINQDVCLIPGCEVNIDQGAAVSISADKNAYVYDRDEWVGGKFVFSNTDMVASNYSPTRADANKFNVNKMTDVMININGTFIASGNMYTTASGANITSSEKTGRFEFTKAAPAATTTYQAVQTGSSISYTSISANSAWLHNGSQYQGSADEYTKTAGSSASDVYFYCAVHDKWEKGAFYNLTLHSNEQPDVVETYQICGNELAIPANPFVREGYLFDGWNSAADGSGTSYADQEVIHGSNLDLYAQWVENIERHTIQFINYDGTLLQSTEVAVGRIPEYTGPVPEKPADAMYVYTFAGWTPEITEVTGDATYTATYTQSIRKYVITWVNDDGTVLQSSEVEYGQMPAYTGETPTKAATAQYTYTFNGWTPTIIEVTGEATYTATYASTVNKYLIKFVNDDGTVLQSSEVEYGQIPAYNGETPTKAATAQYTYTFSGWTPTIVEVTCEATYTATYTSTVNKYLIKFINDDGTVLQSSEVAYGELPAYTGETPTKAATAQYTYTFNGWNPTIVTVTGEATYTAVYDQENREYMITWLDDDGSIIDTTAVAYGEMPVHADPVKPSTAQYSYTFTGWTPELKEVTGEATYTATYTSTVNKYLVRFVNDDGTVLQSTEVEYGQMPAYTGETPTKAATAQYTYTFSSWTPALAEVTGEATYTATYASTVNKYLIKFVNYDGTVLQSSEVEYGQMPAYNGETPTKAATAQYTYTFSGWTPTLVEVTGDATYTAKYDAVEIETLRILSLVNEGTNSGITVNYTNMSAAQKYEIQVSEDGANWTTLTDEETGNSYTDKTATWMGRVYYYRVRMFAEGQWSEYAENAGLLRNPFIDVPEGTDDFTHVAWAYNNDIVNGISSANNLFNLTGRCTRTQFCIMLWKMNGKPSTKGMTCPFEDIDDVTTNNKKGIIWCYNQGIINGTSPTTFAPQGDINRAQLAIMVYKMAGKPSVEGQSCPYTDLDGLTKNNRNAVIWCYNNGIIPSIGDATTFQPKAKGTRALLTEMLYGYNQIYHLIGE